MLQRVLAVGEGSQEHLPELSLIAGEILKEGKQPFLVVERQLSGSEKGVFWKRGLFRKVHFLEILENLEILEFLENPQTVEKKGDSDHFLEILENLEILEILEISPAKRPLS